ncbi:MAG TPA: glutamate--tRNA ligase [Ktedonobacterales bacterium]
MDPHEYEALYPPRTGLPDGAQVTRVAPSPTGRPHIGTALQGAIDRAAASQAGGVFILRIEDTDRTRLVPEAVADIIAALAWLGIAPDEGPALGGNYGPYVQSERLPIYQAAAEWLVAHGHAYRCFCTPQRLEAVRQAQQKAGQPTMYDRHCRTLAPSEVAQRLAAGEPSVIRLAMPANRSIAFADALRGTITFDSNLVDDQVLIKSDGFPTYHLAVVVDDHFMRVTTALRGEEWISSTPKHIVLYEAFGWQMPRIVHTPLLRDLERHKLSKRSGDTSIAWFRTQGYLPDGFRNYLTRLTWTHPDGKDVYPWDEFVRLFSVEALRATAPVADMDLLDFINGQYLRALTPAELYATMRTWLEYVAAREGPTTFELSGKGDRGVSLTPEEVWAYIAAFTKGPAYSQRVLALEPERYKKLGDVLATTRLFYADLFAAPSAAQLAKPLGDGAQARALLDAYRGGTRPDEETHEQWEARVRALAEQMGVKAGKAFMTLRIALTGSEQTPPLYDIVRVLGPDETGRRLALALAALDG